MADDWLSEGAEDFKRIGGAKLKTAVDYGLTQQPDSFARIQKSSKELNTPISLAERNPNEINGIAQRREIHKKLQDTEYLKKAFENPDFASIAHDDVDALTKVENSVSRIRGPKPGYISFMRGLHVGTVEGLEKIRQGIRMQWADLIGSERMRKDALRKYEAAVTTTQRFDPEFETTTMRGVYGGLTSLSRQAPALAASIATKNPALVLGYMGQSVEAESYGKYRARGADPEMAFLGGMGEGAIEVATELMPMGFLVSKFGKTGMGDFLTGMLAREVPGEQIATIVQDAIDTAIANPDKTWGEYVKERPEAAYETLIATLVQTGVVGSISAVSRYGMDVSKSQDALNTQEELDSQVEAVTESKLRNRSPEELKTFLDTALGAEQEVILSPEDAEVFFQTNPELLEALPQELADSINESLSTQNDVVIPKSDYLTYLTEFHDQLTDVVRNDMDGMNAKEANEWVEQGNEQFEMEAERILVEQEMESEFQASADKVAQTIKDQIVQTGRITEEVAEKYSQLHKAFAVSVAEKLEITPEQVYEQVGLQVTGAPIVGEGLEQAQRVTESDIDVVETSKPVTFYYAHNKESATEIFGVPDKESPYGRGFEPSGQYVTMVPSLREDQGNMEYGELTLRNPLVVPNDSLKWKETLSQKYDGKTGKELSLALIADGYDGVITTEESYISEVLNLQTFDEAKALFQEAKGQIQFPEDGAIITLLENADLSTFLHESGHFFFEAYKNLSSNPEIAKDMQSLLDFIEVDNLETWNGMTLEQRREGHEKVARAFEAYLFEGKSPNIEMQSLFSRFRDWLLNVYKNLTALKVELTDEVSQVFDRMLATKEQIREKEVARAYEPLFESAEEAGMTEKQWTDYQNMDERRRVMSESELQTRSLKNMKWLSNAKGKALKALQSEAKSKRKAIKSEITDEVAREPTYMAIKFLKTGETLNAEGEVVKTELHKLDQGEFVERYPNVKTPRGMTQKDGLAMDVAGEMFNFTSGDELIQSLINAEPQKARVDRLTDQRMLETYGDITDPVAMERAAEQAIHNEAHTRFLHTELSNLTKRTGARNVLSRAAKDYAEQAINRKKVKDIKPFQYSAAETRAAKNAEKTIIKGDRESAAEHKRAQVLNNHFFRAANNAQTEIEKMLRYFKKFDREGTRKKLDPEYRDQIDSMLEKYDLRKAVSAKELERRKSMLDWIASQETQDLEPVIDERLVSEAKRQHYKETTVEEMRGLRDSVKNVEHLARLKTKLLKAKDQREFQARMDEARASIIANANRTVKEKATPSDTSGLIGAWTRGIFALHRKFASFLREMDGSKDGGVMWELFLEGMNESGNNEVEMHVEDSETLNEIFKPIRKDISQGGLPGNLYTVKKLIPGTNISMTKEQTLMFAMNWGNEGNRQRLLDGGLTGRRSVSIEEASAILDTLDKKDWDFVQSVLDYIGSRKSQIAEQEKRLTGVEPKWIDPTPIATKYGIYPGGYFPAKYDVALSTRSESLEAATTLRQGMKGAFNSSSTRKSYTQERAKEVKDRPILLNFNAISQHLNEVSHRLAWQDWISDSNRSLKALDGVIREHYGPEVLRELRDTVKDISDGSAPAKDEWETFINRVRVGSTIVGMGYRFTTAIIQPTGLAQSWFRIGGSWITKGLKTYMKNPIEATRLMDEKSKAMRHRGITMQREITEILNTVRAGKRITEFEASFFWLIQKMQRTVDTPTWWGAYEKAQSQLGIDKAINNEQRSRIEEKAISMADQAVIDSQSAGQIKDLAKIQRGSPMRKLWTNFYSYFSATYNLNVEAFRRTKFKSPASVGVLAADLVILNIVPAVMGAALRELIKNECEGDIECMTDLAMHEQINFITGQMIPLREAGAALDVIAGGKAYGYKGPSGIGFFANLYTLGQQAGQGELDAPFWKSANKVAGTILHYPAGQINQTVEGMIAIGNGEVEGMGTMGALMTGPPK